MDSSFALAHLSGCEGAKGVAQVSLFGVSLLGVKWGEANWATSPRCISHELFRLGLPVAEPPSGGARTVEPCASGCSSCSAASWRAMHSFGAARSCPDLGASSTSAALAHGHDRR